MIRFWRLAVLVIHTVFLRLPACLLNPHSMLPCWSYPCFSPQWPAAFRRQRRTTPSRPSTSTSCAWHTRRFGDIARGIPLGGIYLFPVEAGSKVGIGWAALDIPYQLFVVIGQGIACRMLTPQAQYCGHINSRRCQCGRPSCFCVQYRCVM